MYVAYEKLDLLPLNPVSDDNGIRNQLLITLFLKCLEPKQSSTEIIPDVRHHITELDKVLKIMISAQVKGICTIFYPEKQSPLSKVDYAGTNIKNRCQILVIFAGKNPQTCLDEH